MGAPAFCGLGSRRRYPAPDVVALGSGSGRCTGVSRFQKVLLLLAHIFLPVLSILQHNDSGMFGVPYPASEPSNGVAGRRSVEFQSSFQGWSRALSGVRSAMEAVGPPSPDYAVLAGNPVQVRSPDSRRQSSLVLAGRSCVISGWQQVVEAVGFAGASVIILQWHSPTYDRFSCGCRYDIHGNGYVSDPDRHLLQL